MQLRLKGDDRRVVHAAKSTGAIDLATNTLRYAVRCGRNVTGAASITTTDQVDCAVCLVDGAKA